MRARFEQHHAELAALADIIAYETRRTAQRLSHRQIAALLGMSRSWVELVEKQALAKMSDAVEREWSTGPIGRPSRNPA